MKVNVNRRLRKRVEDLHHEVTLRGIHSIEVEDSTRDTSLNDGDEFP